MKRTCFKAAIIIICVCVFGQVNAAPEGLVHHWNFDEGSDWHDDAFGTVYSGTVAYDSVGNNDGSFQNMSASSWKSGVQFTSLKFDGIEDYLLLQADLSGVLGGSSSLSYWIRTPSASVAGITGSDEIQWGGIDAAGKVALTVDGSPVVTSDTVVNDRRWHHVVITRNASTGASQIYLDGVLSAASVGPVGIKNSTFTSIGRVEGIGPGSGYYAGRLDQIHVFNQVIDAAMVAQLMDNHAPKTWEVTTQGTNTASFSTASVFFNSYDPEQDSLSVVSFSQAAHGTVADNGDGSFSYTADAGYVGADWFNVVIEDDRGGFRRSNVHVNIIEDAGAAGQNRTTTFEDFQPIQAGGVDISLSGRRVPRAIDWEGDGDSDLLVGHSGAVWRYINTGSPTSASFSAGVKVQAAGVDIALGGSVLITLMDMTGDGVDDLVAVDNSNKIRIYRNTSAAGAIPVYAAAVIAKQPNNSDFELPDPRFDVGDWDGDGLPDVIMGRWSGDVRVYRNVGTASTARYDSNDYESLNSSSYNLYPRLFDISRNGVIDLLQGINWGSITYWFDPLLNGGLVSSGTLVITDTVGASVDMKAHTDGAIVDFADFNADGVYDILIGGHAGSNVFIAYGAAKTVADCIAENESIYDAHPTGLGDALEANDQALLKVINANSRTIISHMLAAPITERQQMFTDMASHVGSYSFLQMDSALDTNEYHHLPSIAGQNLMTMHKMLPDTPTHRTNVADAVGLIGRLREIYLTTFLHVGENKTSSSGQRASILKYINSLPREIFPDSLLTLNHYWGDGRGGTVNSFRGAKNTFSSQTGGDSGDGFHNDHDPVIEAIFGSGAYRGDYFTLVMGHEVTHSLDGYLNRCGNKDLWRRKGLMMAHAGGPDIVTGSNGWIDWNETKSHFQTQGYWDGVSGNWDTAWSDYWSTGPGSAWRGLSFMRGSIDWFFGAPQEALATQANQHLSHSEGRLVAAIDRWRRGVENGVDPMKANINECVDFLDYVSAGLNKVVLYDTRGVGQSAEYTITHAWLTRNNLGFITDIRVKAHGHEYEFEIDADGIITDVKTNIMTVTNDKMPAFHNKYNRIDVLANDNKLEGGKPDIVEFTQPAHGVVSDNGDGTLRYIPDAGYYGPDSFTYTVAGTSGQGQQTAAVDLTVVSRNGILEEVYNGIGGNNVSDLTGSSKYPHSPDSIEVAGSFQTPQYTGDSYGRRMSGWLTPPAKGSYTFWIASDDGSELWLSSDHDPANASLIGSVSGWTDYKDWDANPEQQSSAVTLVDGNSYYIEALQKEGGGGDHLAVAWSGPGFSRQVISGTYLSASFPPLPEFISNPTIKTAAFERRNYSETVSDTLADVGYGSVEFSKIDGPEWLSVAADGTLSGMTSNKDVGPNVFTVRVVNSGGAFADTNLSIEVYDLFTGELGLEDLAGFSLHWLSTGCVDVPACGGSDLSGDEDVDIDDLVILSEFWLDSQL